MPLKNCANSYTSLHLLIFISFHKLIFIHLSLKFLAVHIVAQWNLAC